MAKSQRWVALESNPDVLNEYAYKVGMPLSWKFIDVYSFDSEMLQTIPQPVAAIILLFPITENSEKYSIGNAEKMDDAYFTQQTISNACGSVAVINALANNAGHISIVENMPLFKFIEATKNMSPSKRAEHLEKDLEMAAVHHELALGGQTEAPDAEEVSSNHFVAIVPMKESLVELNGRRETPVNHGPTSTKTFLEDAIAVVQKFMKRDPQEVNFSVMALVPS